MISEHVTKKLLEAFLGSLQTPAVWVDIADGHDDRFVPRILEGQLFRSSPDLQGLFLPGVLPTASRRSAGSGKGRARQCTGRQSTASRRSRRHGPSADRVRLGLPWQMPPSSTSESHPHGCGCSVIEYSARLSTRQDCSTGFGRPNDMGRRGPERLVAALGTSRRSFPARQFETPTRVGVSWPPAKWTSPAARVGEVVQTSFKGSRRLPG